MRLASQRWLIYVFRDVYSITHTSRILPVFPFVPKERKTFEISFTISMAKVIENSKLLNTSMIGEKKDKL